MKKIALIPIDNRPICYSLVQDICNIDSEIELFMPKRELLGGLQTSSDIEGILNWLSSVSDIDYLIISLDTIAYGGLVNSRRGVETFSEIKSRIEKLEEIIKKKKCKTYAFSSIMRISNNSINEEEKEYWNPWGKKIFDYSYNLHKSKKEGLDIEVYPEIPDEILDDYLNTRKRNFEINKIYLDLIERKIFDFLVYSKDDTGKYGLNVKEAENLDLEIKKRGLNAILKTGADEIPLSLLSKAIIDGKKIKIAPRFLRNDFNLISKYEDISVFDCVRGQIELAGAEFVENEGEADLIAYVNNFDCEQGDLVLGDVINNTSFEFELPKKPYYICDINNANGADNGFIERLFKKGFNESFFGYCGYNTSANTIGCATCCAVTKFLAQKYNEDAFKKLEFIRFADDWGYQANIRRHGGEFKKFEKEINNFLKTNFSSTQKSPWNRTFETEIIVK